MPPPDPPPEGAIDTSLPGMTSPAGWGAFQTTAPATPPPRDAISYIADTALGMVQGGIGVAGGLAGASTRIPEEVLPGMASRRETQTYLQDLSHAVGQFKSKAGQAEDAAGGPDITRDPVHSIAQGVAGIVPYAPVMMTGPLAPVIFGATSIGDVANRISEKIRFAEDKDLMQAPIYRETLQRTGSKEQAQEALYQATNDLASNLIAGGTGAAGGGLLTAMAGKLGNKFLSKVIGDRIMHGWKSRLGVGAAEGFGAGALMTGGTEYGTQESLHQAGFGPPPDWHEIGISAGKSGLTLGAIGGMGKLTFGKRPAPDVGTDVMATAMAREGYGPLGPRAQRPSPGVPMRAEDIGGVTPDVHRGPLGEYSGAEYGPEIEPRAPAAEMAGEDLGGGNVGRLDVSRGPMTAEDIGVQEPPGVMTGADLGMEAHPEYGAGMDTRGVAPGVGAPVGRRPGVRGMRPTDLGRPEDPLMPTQYGEYGPEVGPPPAPGFGFHPRTAAAEAIRRTRAGRRGPMGEADIFGEYGQPEEARPPLRGGERPMEAADIGLSEYGPEIPPRPPSPTGGGGGFGSRLARAEELRRTRRTEMQPSDLGVSEYGAEIEPRGDVVQAGEPMTAGDLYEPGSREMGRAQANDMLDRLEVMKLQRDYASRKGNTRAVTKLDGQIKALRQQLTAHNRALRAGRPPPEAPEATPPRGGGPPEEPPPGGGGGGPPTPPAPTEPPAGGVVPFTGDTSRANLHYGLTAEHLGVGDRLVGADGNSIFVRDIDWTGQHATEDPNFRTDDPHNPVAVLEYPDGTRHALSFSELTSAMHEHGLGVERLSDKGDRDALHAGLERARERAGDSVHGVRGEHVLEDLGVTPHRAGRGGEERVLPEAANAPARETLRLPEGTTITPRVPTKREDRKIPPKLLAVMEKARERIEAGEGEPVNVRAARVPSMDARTEEARRHAAAKEARERREGEERKQRAVSDLLNKIAALQGERMGEYNWAKKFARSLVDRIKRVGEYANDLVQMDINLRTGADTASRVYPIVRDGQRLPLTREQQKALADRKAVLDRLTDLREREKSLDQTRLTDRERKRRQRARHYVMREQAAKRAILDDHPDTLSVEKLSELVGRLFRKLPGEEPVPRGARGARILREGLDPETMPLKDRMRLFESTVQELPIEDLRDIANQINNEAMARIVAGQKGYLTLEANMEEVPAIRMDVFDQGHRGVGLWHRRFAAYNIMMKRINAIIGTPKVDERGRPMFDKDNRPIRTLGSLDTATGGPPRRQRLTNRRTTLASSQADNAVRRLRQIIGDFYHDEMVIRAGGIREIDAADRVALQAAKDQFRRAKEKTKGRPDIGNVELGNIDEAMAEIDRIMVERWGDSDDERVGRQIPTDEEGNALASPEQELSNIFEQIDRVANPQDYETPDARKYARNFRSMLNKFNQSIERVGIPDVMLSVRHALDILQPRGQRENAEGAEYIRQARIKHFENWLDEHHRRQAIDAERLLGEPTKTPAQLEREVFGDRGREYHQARADQFNIPFADWFKLPEEFKQLSIDYNTLITPKDLPEAKLVNVGGKPDQMIPPQRRTMITYPEAQLRLEQEERAAREQGVLDRSPSMTLGDLYLPFQEQLEFIRRLQQGEGTEADLALRGEQLVAKATRLRDALLSIDPTLWRDPGREWTSTNLQNLHNEMRARAGELPEYPRKDMTGTAEHITPEVILADIKRWSMELEHIENEARLHYESLNPDVREMEYGVSKVLDPAADMRAGDSLPRGAYVGKVSDYARTGLSQGVALRDQITKGITVGDKLIRLVSGRDRATTDALVKFVTEGASALKPEELALLEKNVKGFAEHDIPARPGRMTSRVERTRNLEQQRVADNKDFRDALAEMQKVPEFSPYGIQTSNRFVRHLLNMADRIVGNLDVVHLTDEQMDMAVRERGLKEGTPSFYDRPTDRIVVRQSAMRTADRSRLLTHEIAHPIMEAAAQNPKLKAVVKRLDEQRMALKDAFENPDHPQHAEVVRLLDGNDHGLQDVHEFFSELWSNDDFNRALHAVKVSDAQRTRWQTGARQSLLGAVMADIKRGLTGMLFTASKQRLLNDSSVASLDLMQRMQGITRGEPRVLEGEPLARAAASEGEGYTGKLVDEMMSRDEARSQSQKLFVGHYDAGTVLGHVADRLAAQGNQEQSAIARFFAPLLGDVKYHMATDEGWTEFANRHGYQKDEAFGIYLSGKRHEIMAPHDADPNIVIHEAAHALTAKAVNGNEIYRNALQRVINHIQASEPYKAWVREAGKAGDDDAVYLRQRATSSGKEFIAHFYESPEFRGVLRQIKARPGLLDYEMGYAKNMLQQIASAFGKFIRGLAGKENAPDMEQFSGKLILDIIDRQQAMAAEGRLFGSDAAGDWRQGRRIGGSLPARPSEGFVKDVWEGVTERGKDIAAHVNQAGGPTGLVVKAVNFADLARMGNRGMQEVVQKIYNLANETVQRQKAIMERDDHKHIRALADELRIKSPGHVEDVLNYMDHENYVGAAGGDKLGEGANKWVGSRDEPGNRQVHNEWQGLNDMWNRLPESSRRMIEGLRDYYKGRYDAVREATLRDLVHMRGFVEGGHAGATEALMKLISEGRDGLSLSEVDMMKQHVRGFDGYEKPEAARSANNNEFRKYLGEMRAIPEFKKIAGVYYPMMRRGDYVVEAHAKLDRFAQPFGGVEQDRVAGEPPTGHWNFPSKDAANQFIDRMSQDDAPFLKIQKAYETENGQWRVDVNPLHLNFHASLRAAQMEHAALSRDPDMEVYSLQGRRDYGKYAMNPTWATALMKDMIEGTKRTAAYRGLDESTQEILSRQWNELAVRHLMSTSARSRYLPRQYTSGASRNALDNLLQYSSNTSHTLAEKELAPQMRDAVAEMDKYERDMRGSKDPELEKWGLRRSQVKNEVHNRLRMRNDYLASPLWTKALQTVLKLSFLDKLMSPGFLLLNASEPWTIAAPMLAGEHGIKAYGEVAKAYSILGAGRVWAQGGADFAKVLKAGIHGDPQLADTIKLLSQKIKETGFRDQWSTPEELIEMFEHLQKHGYLDRNAGMELEQILNPNANVAGKFLNYLDNAFRQANVQVENVNRGVAGIAGYRLAKMKGATHEEAMAKAQDIVDKSAGNYGYINAPGFFNHPHLKFAFQFKKYALRQTSNIIRVIAGAVRGEPTQMAQLVAMLASQQVISGALGMPTEPFKAMITATNQLGLNPYNTEDVERILNERLAGILGRQGKDAFLYGLPRLLGTGFGARTGWDTLWTYGTLGNKRDDMATAIGHLFGGAPGGMIAEWGQGSHDMAQGIASYLHGARTQGIDSMVNGARNLIPIKTFADAAPALHDAFTGRQKSSGQPFDFRPTVMDTVQRIGGVRTARDLAASQARGAFIRQRDVYNAERTRALQAYAGASTQQEKSAVRDYILKTWNTGRPDVQKINIGDMQKAVTAFERKAKLSPADLGLSITKRTRPFAPNPNVYGFMPSGS